MRSLTGVVAVLSILAFAATAQARPPGVGVSESGYLQVLTVSPGNYVLQYNAKRYVATAITVSPDVSGTLVVRSPNGIGLDGPADVCVSLSTTKIECGDPTMFTGMRIWLSAEADSVRVTGFPNIPVTAYGNAGDDTLIGGAADDDLYGKSGDDFLNGRNGANYLAGNLGVDVCVHGVLGAGC
jgi:Ca2+-binding RTX toxin-like protein